MSERQQHRNPWAEKLSQVSLPDGGESWTAMEALLDRRMPVGRRRDKRRWFLLILLLLLLIGVCNCPGRKGLLTGASKTGGTFQPVPEAGKGRGGTAGPAGPVAGTDRGGPVVPVVGTDRGGPAGPVAGTDGPVGQVAGSAGAPRKVENDADPGNKVSVGNREADSGKYRAMKVVKRPGGETVVKRPGTGSAVKRPGGKTVVKRPGATDTSALVTDDASKGVAKKGGVNKADSSKVGAKRADPDKVGAKKADPDKAGAKKGVVVGANKGGVNKGGVKKEDSSKTERNDAWMVGIGLNQFFTVGGQQSSTYNSGGITGTLGDYIPVPMVRYYVNPRLYVQLETQINTPQYTKKNLVAVFVPHDTISPVQYVQRSVAINKLFYFNVPLSVHYNVVDHLDLGAGLQYSRLTNGIGVFNNNYNNSGTDSLTSDTKSIKGDSAYKEIKTHEFRFMVDANYNWKHFIVGIRYNQALSKFIHVEISPGQVTQSRNSSLQLYLRYILWDGRKKKLSLPAK